MDSIQNHFTLEEEFQTFRPVRRRMSEVQRNFIRESGKHANTYHEKTIDSLKRKGLINDDCTLTEFGERMKDFIDVYDRTQPEGNPIKVLNELFKTFVDRYQSS